MQYSLFIYFVQSVTISYTITKHASQEYFQEAVSTNSLSVCYSFCTNNRLNKRKRGGKKTNYIFSYYYMKYTHLVLLI